MLYWQYSGRCLDESRRNLRPWCVIPESLMDFSLSDELLELKERTERFVRERILPFEDDPRQTPHGPTEELRRELVTLGREAGLLSPHVGREWGGLGLDHRGKAVGFEAGGYAPPADSREEALGRDAAPR